MNVKVAEISEDAVVDMGTILSFENEKAKTIEQKETKSLTYNKPKSLFYTYFIAIIKRIVDVIAGIVGLIVLIPLTFVVFLANRISKEDGPIFYTQERIGKNGKIFKMLKYRSMVVDADEKLKEYLEKNEEARLEYQKYKKLKNDPRITKIGNFIRKTSIDEMPQLLHLLTGEMSLIGPRPYLPREKEDMGEYYNIITKSKPGITGLWQISGRSDVTFSDRLDIDIVYEKNKSLKNDFAILFKTALHLIKSEGAV